LQPADADRKPRSGLPRLGEESWQTQLPLCGFRAGSTDVTLGGQTSRYLVERWKRFCWASVGGLGSAVAVRLCLSAFGRDAEVDLFHPRLSAIRQRATGRVFIQRFKQCKRRNQAWRRKGVVENCRRIRGGLRHQSRRRGGRSKYFGQEKGTTLDLFLAMGLQGYLFTEIISFLGPDCRVSLLGRL